ncbi:hypothetical protein LR48_Vigan07g186300 [Vigna angularis]|uniref:Uncharacterized protein n=1 Tax=Phaseolus angularis TaxID=3914 RepID=A0A0L9V059_PHAAN|nr:hypothetical protein LR48_Vigan07g186300 [Vigna angularis]
MPSAVQGRSSRKEDARPRTLDVRPGRRTLVPEAGARPREEDVRPRQRTLVQARQRTLVQARQRTLVQPGRGRSSKLQRGRSSSQTRGTLVHADVRPAEVDARPARQRTLVQNARMSSSSGKRIKTIGSKKKERRKIQMITGVDEELR